MAALFDRTLQPQATKKAASEAVAAIAVGGYVTVVDDYANGSYGDAGSGPLKPGKIGKVLEDDESSLPFKVGNLLSAATVCHGKASCITAAQLWVVLIGIGASYTQVQCLETERVFWYKASVLKTVSNEAVRRHWGQRQCCVLHGAAGHDLHTSTRGGSHTHTPTSSHHQPLISALSHGIMPIASHL